MDFNLQWDTRAAEIVAASAELTLATLPATMQAHLRAADLPRLRASGPLGELLARQSVAHAGAEGMAELGRAHPGLPNDLVNFHYDPVACAVALGWDGATVEATRLRLVTAESVMRFQRDVNGRLTNVVVNLDGKRFRERWLTAMEATHLAR